MSTQTPRADEAITAFHEGWYPKEWGVSADFARQLERENAELRGKLEFLANHWQGCANIFREFDGNECVKQLRAILNEGQKP